MQTQRTSSNFSVFGGNWNIRRVSLIALILGFVVLSGPQLLPAQDTVTKTQATRDRMYCYQKGLEPGSTGGGRVVVNGFTVEVKTVRDPDDPDYMTCKATIRSSEGKTVFEHADWGMEVEPITG